MNTSHSRSKSWQASASAEPHCPAPVSVASLRIPASLVVVGLGDGGVRLVRAGGRDALVLVVDVGGGIERALEPARAQQRGRAPELVDLANLVGDLDLRLGRDLLLDQRHREQRREVLGAERLLGARDEAAAAARPAGRASRLTQWVGIADSGSGNWICSLALTASPLWSSGRSIVCPAARATEPHLPLAASGASLTVMDGLGGNQALERLPAEGPTESPRFMWAMAAVALRRRRLDRRALADRPAPGVVRRRGAVEQHRDQLHRRGALPAGGAPRCPPGRCTSWFSAGWRRSLERSTSATTRAASTRCSTSGSASTWSSSSPARWRCSTWRRSGSPTGGCCSCSTPPRRLAHWVTTMGTIVLGAFLIESLVARVRRAARESAAIARERAELMATLAEVARTDDLTGLAQPPRLGRGARARARPREARVDAALHRHRRPRPVQGLQRRSTATRRATAC